MQELEHWKTKFDIVGTATEGFFSKQWLSKRLFGMSDEEFIRNRREMFYDKKYEAALETVGEAEQAAMTAGLDAGPDPGLGLTEPGGVGTVGQEPELGAPDLDTATPPPGGGPPDAGAPAGDSPGADDGALLATPPGKREDGKGRTTTAKSHGWYEPRSTKPGGDRRKSSGPRKKNMTRAASPETGTSRKLYPGYSDLTGLAKATSIYEEQGTNYKLEELKILNQQKELDSLFESLKEKDKKNETET